MHFFTGQLTRGLFAFLAVFTVLWAGNKANAGEEGGKKGPVLSVVMPEMPRHFSPALARSMEEKLVRDLLFSSLTHRVWVKRGKDNLSLDASTLCRSLPFPNDRTMRIELDPERKWSDGRAVTSADVRHTYVLFKSSLAARNPLIRELVEKPGLPTSATRCDLVVLRPLFDPLSVTRVPLLPAQVLDPKTKNPMLPDLNDPAFDNAPTGSGSFRLGKGKTDEEGAFYLPFHALAGGGAGEVRIYAADTGKKGPKEPHVVVRPEPGQWDALLKAGFRAPSVTPGKVLHYLAINHRRPALSLQEFRVALAHAIHREKLLQEHWNPKLKGSVFDGVPASGPFEAGAWTFPLPTLFKTDPFPLGSDRLHARTAAKKLLETIKDKEVKLSLLCPANDIRAREASKSIKASWTEAFKDSGVDLRIQIVEASSADMEAALRKREFDLAWQTLDHPEEIGELWTLLDDHDPAIHSPEGGNILGYRDPELVGLFRKTLEQQPFSQVQAGYHKIHVRLYDRMPFVPLWHEAPPVAVHSSLREMGEEGTPQNVTVDPRSLFQNVTRWVVK